jgi:hypothetical protein
LAGGGLKGLHVRGRVLAEPAPSKLTGRPGLDWSSREYWADSHTYGKARPLVEHAGELGESLAIVLATKWEAKHVLAAAGHTWNGYA